MKKVMFFGISTLLIIAVLPNVNASNCLRWFFSPADQVVVDAIEQLSFLEELSCSVDCSSTIQSANFSGGYIAMRGPNEERLEKGNGEVWIRDDDGYEIVRGSESSIYEWNDSGQSFAVWSTHNGIEDVRVPLLVAAQTNGLVLLANEDLDGTDCVVIEGGGLKLWFDSTSQNRLLKCDVSFAPEISSELAYSIRYGDWAQIGMSEYPQTTQTTAFDPRGQVIDVWNYEFYGFTTGMHLSNSVFDRNTSDDGGNGGGPGGGMEF